MTRVTASPARTAAGSLMTVAVMTSPRAIARRVRAPRTCPSGGNASNSWPSSDPSVHSTSAVVSPDGTVLVYQPYGKAGLLIADIDLDEATRLLATRCKEY